MGTWGAKLYANDFTKDIRDDYIDKLKRGKKVEEATKEMIEENACILEDEEEGPLFWYALADTQWDYGRLQLKVRDQALFFIEQNAWEGNWKEQTEDFTKEWKNTLCKLKEKLLLQPPPEKRVKQYRLYQCKWVLGDVFAYQFSNIYSKEKGLANKYIVFRKISEDTWWPGHIVPVVQVYKTVFDNIPSLAQISGLELLPLSWKSSNKNIKLDFGDYLVKLITESKTSIPYENLTYIGNVPGNDIIPFQGHNYWTGYLPLGWENSKYNLKFEHYLVDKIILRNNEKID